MFAWRIGAVRSMKRVKKFVPVALHNHHLTMASISTTTCIVVHLRGFLIPQVFLTHQGLMNLLNRLRQKLVSTLIQIYCPKTEKKEMPLLILLPGGISQATVVV